MAVLPWGHSRSRTTSNDKRSKPALEWFSRSGGSEPSRQALTSLIKEHTRSASAASSGPMSRSSTSQSHYSKHSLSLQVNDNVEHGGASPVREESRPSSPFLTNRPSSPAFSLVSTLDRFGMSGSLKRKSSKMSMSSEAAASPSPISPSRLGPSRLGFFRKESPVSPTKDEVKTPVISKPFAFQHITHSDQSQFDGLNKINETELASRFGAVQASQGPDHALRGIATEELGQTPPERPCSPSPQPGEAVLPVTPPRPSPPPKTTPRTPMQQTPRLEVRTSRSMENFSRPTPRSPASPIAASPSRMILPQLPQLMEADEPQDSIPRRAPFHPPSLVHAVSTHDDTAQYMKSNPLPPPPFDPIPTALSPQQEPATRNSLRHMSTFPSGRQEQQRQRFSSFIPETRLMDIEEEKERIPRYKSEDALTKYGKKSTSPALATPKHEAWEDAIEDAWDQADEQLVDHSDSSDDTCTAANLIDDECMTMNSFQGRGLGSRSPTQSEVQSSRPAPPSSTQNETRRASSQIFGLGINSDHESSSLLGRIGTPSLDISVPDRPRHDDYQGRKTTYSAISKSSSQESIILSIASSILGTQRSSSSSVSPSELSRLSKCDDPASATLDTSTLPAVDSETAARPESTCIPVSLLQDFATTSLGDSQDGSSPSLDTKDHVPDHVSSKSPPSSPQRGAKLDSASPRKRTSPQTSRRNGRASYSLWPTPPS